MRNQWKMWLAVFALALAGVLVYYVYLLPRSNDSNKSSYKTTPTVSISPIATATATPLSQEDVDFRNNSISYVSKNIATLSPAQPVLGGKWFVTRFWFASGSQFYVEYEDGHILRQILIDATIAEKITQNGDEQKLNPVYTVKAYFEPGESGWILKQGTDTLYGKALDLYEYDSVQKIWIKKN